MMTGIVRNIPPIGTKGLYTLIAPFTASASVVYTTHAIRSFRDLQNLGTRIFETYYDPLGLETSDFERDRRNDEMIVTLLSDTQSPIYVPSSYIASYPDTQLKPYSHVVISASLGPLPDTLDLTAAMAAMAIAIQDVVGAEPTMNLSKAPSSQSISPNQHAILESARAAAINNQETLYGRYLAELQANALLQQRLAIFEQIIIDNNLIPEPPP